MGRLKDIRARARIRMRLERVALANFGNAAPVGDGISELRIDYGPGYRLYHARHGKAVVRQGRCVAVVRWGQAYAGRRHRTSKGVLGGLPPEATMKPYRDYQDGLLDALRDAAEAAAYLTAALEEEDRGVFLRALRNVAQARGVDVEALEGLRVGDGALHDLEEVLRRVGLRLTVQANDRQVASARMSPYIIDENTSPAACSRGDS